MLEYYLSNLMVQSVCQILKERPDSPNERGVGNAGVPRDRVPKGDRARQRGAASDSEQFKWISEL